MLFRSFLAEMELAESVAPIQLAIRLLIPAGSKLLELSEVVRQIGEFDEQKLSYQWSHGDPRVEELYRQVWQAVRRAALGRAARAQTFTEVWNLARQATGSAELHMPPLPPLPARCSLPFINEAWFC